MKSEKTVAIGNDDEDNSEKVNFSYTKKFRVFFISA